jgi:hypothetical protein
MDAIYCQDEDLSTLRLIGGIGIVLAQEYLVLRLDCREFARPHSHERVGIWLRP